jgi:hypothetical protein
VLAPIGNKSVVKNSTLTFTATATDADKGQKVNYSLIGAPAGATINATSGVFSWAPSTTGNFTFKVRATDNSPQQLFDEEQITVSVTATFNTAITEGQQSITAEKTKATIYPNPVIDRFSISMQLPADKLTLKIIDIKGAVVKSYSYSLSGKTRIEGDASNLTSGIYIAEIETTSGKQSLKFIKK